MSRKMIDYKVENGTITSIDGYEVGGGKAKTVTVKQSDLEKGTQGKDTETLNELKKDLENTVLQIVNDSGETVGEFKFKDNYYYDGRNRYAFIGWFLSTEGNSHVADVGKRNYPLYVAKAMFSEYPEGKYTLEIYVDGYSGGNLSRVYSGGSGNIRFTGLTISENLGGLELLSSTNQSQIRIQNAYIPANSKNFYIDTNKEINPLCLFSSFSSYGNPGVLLGFKDYPDGTTGQYTKSGYLFLGFKNLTDTIYPSGYATDNGHKLVLSNKVPDCPTSEDGTYTLKCSVSGGVATYSWVKDA